MEQVNEIDNSNNSMLGDKYITDNEGESINNSGSDGENNSGSKDIKIEKSNDEYGNEEDDEDNEYVIRPSQEPSKDQLPQYTSQSLFINNSSQYETNYNAQQYNQQLQQQQQQQQQNHHNQINNHQQIHHQPHQPSLLYDVNYFNALQSFSTNDSIVPNNTFQSNGSHHINQNYQTQPQPIQYHNNGTYNNQNHFNIHQTPIIHNPFTQNQNINSNLDSSQLFNINSNNNNINNNINNNRQLSIVQQNQPNKPKPSTSKKRNSGRLQQHQQQQLRSNQLYLADVNNGNNSSNIHYNEELIFNWYESILKNIIIDETHFKIENSFNRESGYTIFKQLFINHFGEIDQLDTDTIDYIKLHIEILDELTGLTKFHFDSTDNFYNNYIRIINGYALIPAKDSGATIKARPKKGAKLSKESKEILENWIKNHIAHPYPTNDEKESLQKVTGLTPNQVSNWFINTRRRKVPTLCDEAGMVINDQQPLSTQQQHQQQQQKFNQYQFNQFNQMNNIINTTTSTTTTTTTRSNNIQFNDNEEEEEEEED